MPPAIHTNSRATYRIVHINERAMGVFEVSFLKVYLRRPLRVYILNIYTMSGENRSIFNIFPRFLKAYLFSITLIK